jgi:hypothetical protein
LPLFLRSLPQSSDSNGPVWDGGWWSPNTLLHFQWWMCGRCFEVISRISVKSWKHFIFYFDSQSVMAGIKCVWICKARIQDVPRKPFAQKLSQDTMMQ